MNRNFCLNGIIFYSIFFFIKVSDLGEEKFIEHTLSDLVYHVAHEGTYG